MIRLSAPISYLPTVILWFATGIAAWHDWRVHRIPPFWIGVAVGTTGIWLLLGVWPISRLLWGAGIWGFYELGLRRMPESVGWGDVQWATLLMIGLGPWGIIPILAGHLGIEYFHWRYPHRVGHPWMPGAWGGLTGLGLFWIIWVHG
ncbi:hypothetical protein TPY_2648 [Sulfobacillus acidophilus TPY]|uniref:Uncharacterized protein n=1 Tax=Sulfobacillus acidophilus (strain ATCC 700253 / DSM 10332 / NAL) TaxID=679936 RepID=G8TV92_SULAD|nr:hypothetical protein TPY_2648 [Sulfobacillus acidophilus TPY]AEW04732.1 hypothetical protein Sulac_1232 [Sulfobacillus acidophilus DSM 10332]